MPDRLGPPARAGRMPGPVPVPSVGPLPPPQQVVQKVTGTLGSVVSGAGSMVGSAVSQTTGTVGGGVGTVSPSLGGAVSATGSGAANAVGGVTQSVAGALSGLGH
jgi:hypothetical protein